MACANLQRLTASCTAALYPPTRPQGDHKWPETSNRKRLELLLNFWEVRHACGQHGMGKASDAVGRQALESPSTNFTHSPRRLIMEWHAEAHLLPPWERVVEVRKLRFRWKRRPCLTLRCNKQIMSWIRYAARVRRCPVKLVTFVRQPVDLYARCSARDVSGMQSAYNCLTVVYRTHCSWYKYEGLRMTEGQALVDWVADNPNLQARHWMVTMS